MSGRSSFPAFILYICTLRQIPEEGLGTFRKVKMGLVDDGGTFSRTYDLLFFVER